ncbi:MAG TPA: hypothetical protein VD713_04585, partial [Sphingomonadales bacterium]|nr:hypothetical protein [Sphingomonadales bacterium]
MTGEKDDDLGDPAPEDEAAGESGPAVPEEEAAEGENEETEDDDVWFRPDQAPVSEREEGSDYHFKDDSRRSLLIAGSIIAVFLF